MARFELNGAPNKETPGAVGDICTDTLTNKKYKLASMTKRYAYGKSHIEYHWVDFNDIESLSDRIEVLEQGGISEEAAERIIAEKMNEMGSLTADQINALIDDKANVSDIQTINDEIDEINEKLENFDGNVDLTDYAKVEDVYTKDEIDAKGYLTEIPDNYATTDDLNLKANVDEVYSIDEIDAKGFLTEIPDEYVTNDELDLKANAADVYTKAEIDAMGALTEIPEEYITEEELEAKGYATQDDLLLKADADSVYTKDEIDAMGALTEIPDEYITEDELTAKGYLVGDDITNLEKNRVYNTIEELNAAKGSSIVLTPGEDNTIKIINALSPVETFMSYFGNTTNYNRFGIDNNTYGDQIASLIITKYANNMAAIRAYMSNGKILIRRYVNATLETKWSYDGGTATDLTAINTKLAQLENAVNNSGNGHNYSTNEVTVGTWTNGKTLYRRTISDRTERTTSNGTMSKTVLTLSTPSNCEVVKCECVARIASASSTTGNYTVVILPYYVPIDSTQIYISYNNSSGNLTLIGTNMNDYKILGLDISIYYYKN